MKKLVIGILAHVDAGKTTLSEAMLYTSGARRTLGRVDHGNAFLDTDAQEQERGITIFSKQALLSFNGVDITLLDTPGHADFSSEMERTLQVLDCAILVISGTDGVQGHTRTLWKLLETYNIPAFIFVNKMDLDGADKENILAQLKSRLSDGCIDFSSPSHERDEAVAMRCEDALDEFLENGNVSFESTSNLIASRKVFPVWFGSALKLEGTEEFLADFVAYAKPSVYSDEFGAKVFKISHDEKNQRLTWLKITGGKLRAKSVLSGGSGEIAWQEKADQLRLYSGAKFSTTDEACAGDVIAVCGLTKTHTGMGLGIEPDSPDAILEPVLNYRLILPDGCDAHTVLPQFKQLEEEDPMLKILWNEEKKEIHVRLMGQIQLEVLRRLISDRFNLQVDFGAGSIVYKETIANRVEGIGHFEPLRHYAEVHLLMEPAPRGSGIEIVSACPTDKLDLNWQRLIFTHVAEREHPGVLTGSAITDMKISVVAGRAHVKHTEGGDFRQATYRAIRQGLMQAESILLEPFYDFTLEVPPSCVGRAMTDIQTMGGELSDPVSDSEMTILSGYAPVAGLTNYWQDVTAYTRGLGRLACSFRGYEPCKNQQAIVREIGYDPERDTENTPDSVFCDHGAGFNVKWNQVREYMHVDSGLRFDKKEISSEVPSPPSFLRSSYAGTLEQDKELEAIFERTYGKVDPRRFHAQPPAASYAPTGTYKVRENKKLDEFLLVDGYNIIFAWDELKKLAEYDLSAARAALEDILINYRGFKNCTVILVFDAHKVRENPGSVEKSNGIYVVYTKTAETADNYIERTTYQLGRDKKVMVATSDGLEQMIILGHGALRISASGFKSEIATAQIEISKVIQAHNGKIENNPIIRKKK